MVSGNTSYLPMHSPAMGDCRLDCICTSECSKLSHLCALTYVSAEALQLAYV